MIFIGMLNSGMFEVYGLTGITGRRPSRQFIQQTVLLRRLFAPHFE